MSPSSEVRERPWGGGLTPMGGVTVLPRGGADKVVALVAVWVGPRWSALSSAGLHHTGLRKTEGESRTRAPVPKEGLCAVGKPWCVMPF